MDELYIASIVSVSLLLISISIWYNRNPNTLLPPGPWGFPVLGYLPFLIGKDLLNQLTKLGHKYGPIFKLYLGNKLLVVISSPSLVKEVVREKDGVFSHRYTPVAAFVASYGGNDVAFSEPNSRWRAMRKIFVQEMMSNKCLEESRVLRKDHVRKAIRQVHDDVGKPVEIGRLGFRTELNVMMNMLWGGTIEAGEQGRKIEAEFCGVISKVVDLSGKPNISDFYPLIAGLDIQGVKKQMEAYMQSLDTIFEDVIAQHKSTLSSAGEMIREKRSGRKDFLQTLLELQNKQDSDMSISHKQVKALLMDVVSAGTDTTATTVEWAMAGLMNNPGVMTKAQKELSEVVGLNNIVEESHIPKLKYLEAVIKETLRLYPPGPLLAPRCASDTSTVGGYTIPKNTMVFINICSIQRDPSIWDNPMEFKPERFLDDNNNGKCDYRGNHFHYLPFGSGRRICAGIPLAERMLLYFLASLLHSFDWKIEQGETIDMSETFGIALRKTTPLFGIPTPRLSDSTLYV
ncbi:hypothetical protein ABFS82_05G085700 [Erythranthe guttata]